MAALHEGHQVSGTGATQTTSIAPDCVRYDQVTSGSTLHLSLGTTTYLSAMYILKVTGDLTDKRLSLLRTSCHISVYLYRWSLAWRVCGPSGIPTCSSIPPYFRVHFSTTWRNRVVLSALPRFRTDASVLDRPSSGWRCFSATKVALLWLLRAFSLFSPFGCPSGISVIKR